MATTFLLLGKASSLLFLLISDLKVSLINKTLGDVNCSMDAGMWDESKIATYNMIDAVSRSTVQVVSSPSHNSPSE